MCGIFGYVGSKKGANNAVDLCLEGLKCLEYRGYDSAGLVGIQNDRLVSFREVGKVGALEKQVKKKPINLDSAIAHTRWATHGKPTAANAHPQFDASDRIAVVHNGIIENYDVLRKQLQSLGVHFRSDTDTEVIAQLIGFHYQDNLVVTLRRVIPMLKGAYAIAVLHTDYPQEIVAATCECPLAIGLADHGVFVASDTNAFFKYAKQALFLSNQEIAVLQGNKVNIVDMDHQLVEKTVQNLVGNCNEVSKGDFEHFMLKEIFEQPQTVRNAMLHRLDEARGSAFFEELTFSDKELKEVERILIVACGTSLHAGHIAAYLMESLAKIPVQVEIASEFRYKESVISPHTLVIGISQSGETADTLASLRVLKTRECKILGICNVQASTLAREVECSLFLRAGPEIGVASTKAFTSQLTVLALLSLFMARLRGVMTQEEGQVFLSAMEQLPKHIEKVLNKKEEIAAIAKKYFHIHDVIFLGRNLMYPTCLEAALKLKEISYVNANGYAAGEMKHGPIALVSENCLIAALCAHQPTYDKVVSNLMELKARNGRVLAFATTDQLSSLKEIAEELIELPSTIDELAPILSTIATQLFAYEIAKLRGADIDQPRNLAKSVTVE